MTRSVHFNLGRYKKMYLQLTGSIPLCTLNCPRLVHCKFNCITVNFDRTWHGILSIRIYYVNKCISLYFDKWVSWIEYIIACYSKLYSEDMFTRLIWLTLFMTCIYMSPIPIWNCLQILKDHYRDKLFITLLLSAKLDKKRKKNISSLFFPRKI